MTSFLTIGGVAIKSTRLMFLPFPTRPVAEAIRTTSAERTAVTDRELLRPEVSDEELAGVSAAARPSLVFYVVFMLLAILTPHVAAFGYLVVAIQHVWLVRGDTGLQPAG